MQRLGAPLVLVLLCAIVYGHGLSGSFIFDDFSNLLADETWKVTSLDAAAWHRAMINGIASVMGRPLAMLSFAINHYFTGTDPFYLKASNLAIHAINGVLVYRLLCGIFAASPSIGAADSARMGRYAAWIVAAAWLVHPIQVSTVLYIVQRMELAANTGVLLALLAYLSARRRQLVGQRAWPWFLLALLATVLGLGFKETAALAPGYALALELTVLKFRAAEEAPSRRLRWAYLAGTTLALLAFVLVILPANLAPEAYAYRDFTLVQRLLTQPHVLVTYLSQIVLPLPNRFPFYYDAFPISTGLLSPVATLVSIIALVSIAVTAVLLRTRAPLVSLGVAWFFLAHALTSNVIPLELAFEHRNYFALLGILIAAAQLLWFAGRRLDPAVGRLLAAVPVVFLAIMCAIQSSTWGDPMQLALALASRAPDSPRAGYGLGLEMLSQSGKNFEGPLVSLATREFQTAARMPGASPLAEQALIMIHAKKNEPVPPEIWLSFQRKLRTKAAGPEEEAALYGVLQCRIQLLCKFDDQQLLDTVLVAVDRNPQSPVIHALYSNLALNVLADTPLAIRLMRECIRLAPNEVQYQANLLRLLRYSGADSAELSRLRARVEAADPAGLYREDTSMTSGKP